MIKSSYYNFRSLYSDRFLENTKYTYFPFKCFSREIESVIFSEKLALIGMYFILLYR